MPGEDPRTPESGRERSLATRREALGRSLAGRFWLRFHASVIVSGTFASGFLANALMLQWPVHSVWLRWPLAVLAGYAVFFVLVRLWLVYVGIRPLGGATRSARDRNGSLADLPIPEFPAGGGSVGSGPSIGGAGGGSGGGGASGFFGGASQASATRSVSVGASDTRAAVGGTLADLDPGGADGCLFVVLGLVVLALVAALLGSAVHLIWVAPDMLTDAAFAALLSAGALPGLARVHAADWNGRVFRATLPVLAIVLSSVLAAAWAFTHWFPGLRTLGEAYRMLF